MAALSVFDELYVLARCVLLDALVALGEHRNALVLVGAQAVYLRVGEADLAVAPFTTDGDLAIDPDVLAQNPPLEQALTSAGFYPKGTDSVGIWITKRKTNAQVDTEFAVDLLVPAALTLSTGRRATRLSGHHSRAARIVTGLDGAVVDADVMKLTALDTADARTFGVRVAGLAALLVAKAHKISERQAPGARATRTPSTSCDCFEVHRLISWQSDTQRSSLINGPKRLRRSDAS